MSPTNNLVMSNIVHKSFVEVNEEGTEAAAATAAVVTIRSAELVKSFRADHPFLFFIRHNDTKSILFAGRFSSPEWALQCTLQIWMGSRSQDTNINKAHRETQFLFYSFGCLTLFCGNHFACPWVPLWLFCLFSGSFVISVIFHILLLYFFHHFLSTWFLGLTPIFLFSNPSILGKQPRVGYLL